MSQEKTSLHIPALLAAILAIIVLVALGAYVQPDHAADLASGGVEAVVEVATEGADVVVETDAAVPSEAAETDTDVAPVAPADVQAE